MAGVTPGQVRPLALTADASTVPGATPIHDGFQGPPASVDPLAYLRTAPGLLPTKLPQAPKLGTQVRSAQPPVPGVPPVPATGGR